jgi:hypothetical protein
MPEARSLMLDTRYLMSGEKSGRRMPSGMLELA